MPLLDSNIYWEGASLSSESTSEEILDLLVELVDFFGIKRLWTQVLPVPIGILLRNRCAH